MKITIATGPIFPVPAVRGGAVQRLWEGLAHEFVKGGHEVTIFAREFTGQATEETVDGIRYVRRGGYAQSTSIKLDLVQCLLFALKTARHVPPGDVVVTNDFWMPAVLPWLKPSAGRIVVNANRFPKKQYWLYSKCAALAAVSQAVADALKEQTPSAADKVVVVPNAIDEVFLRETKRLKDQGTKGLQDYGTTGQGTGPPAGGTYGSERGRGEQVGDTPVKILYVGRIHPEKGLGLLANALRLLAEDVRQAADGIRHTAEGERGQLTGDRPSGSENQPESRIRGTETGRRGDQLIRVGEGHALQLGELTGRRETDWECVLVGPVKQSEGGGGEAFAEELKRQVEGLPVRFEAPVYDPAALAKIYDEADVFVYPSVAETGEAMPLAPVEAMARGVVPVVSDLSVFREYLAPGENGMVFDHRSGGAAENLAKVLCELIADAGQRERMGVAARQTAERFSPSAIADKYLQLFQKVVSGT